MGGRWRTKKLNSELTRFISELKEESRNSASKQNKLQPIEHLLIKSEPKLS